jgi:uncharacterized membrane protein YraQ (UPF0718 family)
MMPFADSAVSAGLSYVKSSWLALVQMAPYLLLGFAVAGVMSVLLPTAWVARHLGGRTGWGIVKASLFGIPLPLCSCGVIPVAAQLRRSGASRGAMAAFLMSTPQTGVDSWLVTYGLLGPIFAIFRPLAALVSGVACGWLVQWADRHVPPDLPPPVPHASSARSPAWRRMLKHGFVLLPSDLSRPLLVGLLVSGGINLWVPPDFFSAALGSGSVGPLVSILAMIAIGVPLYVCSTASVPIGAALLAAGIPPGAVLAFLITGPATNAATIVALVSMLGRRSATIYLASLVITAIAAGLVLDRIMPGSAVAAIREACRHGDAIPPVHHFFAVTLLGLLVLPLLRRRK